jgi:hypothetical protein
MLPAFLIPETTIREAGSGLELSLRENRGGVLVLTLGITRIVQQESLDISVWGSQDGIDWGTKPIIAFPLKFYCGTYQVQSDLTQRPQIKRLRAKWQVNRWGGSDLKPLFTIYLFAEILGAAALAIGA